MNSNRNEGKDYFEINRETGEIFTKIIFDREKQGAYALEVEARDGAPSARPNSNGQPNSGKFNLVHTNYYKLLSLLYSFGYDKTIGFYQKMYNSTVVTNDKIHQR